MEGVHFMIKILFFMNLKVYMVPHHFKSHSTKQGVMTDSKTDLTFALLYNCEKLNLQLDLNPLHFKNKCWGSFSNSRWVFYWMQCGSFRKWKMKGLRLSQLEEVLVMFTLPKTISQTRVPRNYLWLCSPGQSSTLWMLDIVNTCTTPS